jgi:glycosyltransferase involved in cell wall biosynthesis
MKYSRWITCTPVAFRGDEKTFFSRDSGLCCRALQALGAQAKVVMPEPAWDDEPDVLRVPYARLNDPEFWRTQDAEAVILYSWADPRYTAIAQAIRVAGLKLHINMDTDGLISPLVEPAAYIRLIWRVEQLKRGFLKGSLIALCRIGWQSVALHKHFSRLRQMSCADAIGVVSPIAAERVKKYVRLFGRNDITGKIHFVSHPIDQTMQYNDASKQERVIAIGRWDDVIQKRSEVLIEVAEKVLSKNPTVQFAVVGKDSVKVAAAIAAGVPQYKDRVAGYERLEHDELCRLMSSSQISLCTSRFESLHTVSGEALLCGCSVVAPQSPYLPSQPYFTDGGQSGRLADENPDALAAAVLAELEAWKIGARDAAKIAAVWRERIGAGTVIRQIDKLIL